MSEEKTTINPFVPSAGEPRANFAVFAGFKGKPQGGYRDYQGGFWSLCQAKAWAEKLLSEHPAQVEWVQVTNTFHGAIEELEDGVWIVVREDDPI